MRPSGRGACRRSASRRSRSLYPDYPIWRGKDFKYEYTDDVLAIDVINGGPASMNGSMMRRRRRAISMRWRCRTKRAGAMKSRTC